MRRALPSLLLVALWLTAAPAAAAGEPAGLHEALEQLARDHKLSGAVVVRGAEGVRFARGYGLADPFEGRAFTADTPVDSASLAKPLTSAGVLLLARDGAVDLDAPVQRYLPEYPHPGTTVRHLLSHSAGLRLEDSPAELAGKSNAALVAGAGPPLFPPGSAFTYCNLCSITLALLIERVTGTPYLDFLKARLAAPQTVGLRPYRLADWRGRAIGYRRQPDGTLERFDSWEGEVFYGAANLSISAAQLAQWGSQWWGSEFAPIQHVATTPARIAGSPSGLTLGNWYCAPRGKRCHYLGHHQGFHHMLYWDADQRLSVAMVTNNALSPGLQQRVQRALVAFAEGHPEQGRRELESPQDDSPAPAGCFDLSAGEAVEVVAQGAQRSVRRAGVDYPAYPAGVGILYVPGLDVYVCGLPDGGLHWLSLYEDRTLHQAGRAARQHERLEGGAAWRQGCVGSQQPAPQPYVSQAP